LRDQVLSRISCITLIAVGLSVSAFLLWRHTQLAGTPPGGQGDVCSAIFGLACDQTLRSPTAIQLGLPLAGWGIVYYGTLVSLLLLGWFLGQPFDLAAALAALALASVAALLSIVLFGLMVSGQVAFCPLCACCRA
jgi:uncharacterized membrane protein